MQSDIPTYKERQTKTPEQVAYLQKWCGVISDLAIAVSTGLSESQVSYYRHKNMKKDSYQSTRSEIHTIDDVKNELDALLKFHANYSGCMIESLEYRIKLLSVKTGI